MSSNIALKQFGHQVNREFIQSVSLLISVKFSQLLEQPSFIELAFSLFLSLSLFLSFRSLVIFTIDIHKFIRRLRTRTIYYRLRKPFRYSLYFTPTVSLKYTSFYVHVQVLLVIKFERLSLANISRIIRSFFTVIL